MDVSYYVKMLTALDIDEGINMNGDHALMVVMTNSRYLVTNVDNAIFLEKNIICHISPDFASLNKIILPSLVQLHTFVEDLLAASDIFPQTLSTTDLETCLGFSTLDFWSINVASFVF